MKITILKGYNNYFNRIIKKENDYAGYITAASDNALLTSVNFNPNDGVDTEFIFNFDVTETVFTPDYCLVTDSNNNIISRWFVTDAPYVRERQLKLSLHRDVIVDNYTSVTTSSAYIERGIPNSVKASGSSLIHPYLINSEPVSFNKQKQSQTEIKDNIGCAWIIGYIAPDSEAFHYSISCGADDPYYEFQLRIRGTNLNNEVFWGFYNKELEIWVYTKENISDNTTYTTQELTTASTAWPLHEKYPSYTYIKGPAYMSNGVQVNISASIYKPTLPNCVDAPYNLFAIPYGEVGIYENDTDTTPAFLNSPEIGLSMAELIQTQLTSNNIYDLQLIPYCPIKAFTTKGKIYKHRVSPSKDIINTQINNTVNTGLSIIFYPEYSKYELTISNPMSLTNTPLDYKKDANLTSYRLTSQNYSSSFEFKLSSNNGSITGFKAKVTLKPINPTIQLKPYPYSGLYSDVNYDDKEGLIVQGDLSLPQMTDAWETYEYQNKNYQEIFNKQLQSQDLNQTYALKENYVNTFAGVLGAASSGGSTGYMASRSAGGTVMGMVLGAIGTAAGGLQDDYLARQRYEKERAITVETQRLNVGNITSQSSSISNVGSFTNVSKLFPTLEKYSCTSEETTVFENYLTWNGWNIGVYDNISNWTGGNNNQKYIKGSMLRNTTLYDDTHMFNTINKELQEGVYM